MPGQLTDWTLVIDLDGTLVETAPDLHAALNHVLAREGLDPIPLDEIRSMIGDGAKALIRKGLAWNGAVDIGPRLDTDLWPEFLDHYTANICRLSQPYDGAVGALDSARDRGAVLTICTNKTQALAEAVLDGLGLRTRFAAIIGADRTRAKKPEADHILDTLTAAGRDRRRAIMIGDSDTDQTAARRAGLPFVFAEFGYGSLDPSNQAEVARLPRWADLEPVLAALINS